MNMTPINGPRRLSFSIEEAFQIPRVRAELRSYLVEAGFGGVDVAEILICVTELASNLVEHATRGGRLSVEIAEEEVPAWVELGCRDDGPGIKDTAAALEDGFSTSGGLGCGLPAVRRLMDEFEIISENPKGTIVVARKYAQTRSSVNAPDSR